MDHVLEGVVADFVAEHAARGNQARRDLCAFIP